MPKKSKNELPDMIADLLKTIGGSVPTLDKALRQSASKATQEMANNGEKDDCDCPACKLRRSLSETVEQAKAEAKEKGKEPDVQVRVRSFSSAEEAQDFIKKLMAGEIPDEEDDGHDNEEIDVNVLDTIDGVGGVSKLHLGIAKEKGLVALQIEADGERQSIFLDKKALKSFAISMIAATATLGA